MRSRDGIRGGRGRARWRCCRRRCAARARARPPRRAAPQRPSAPPIVRIGRGPAGGAPHDYYPHRPTSRIAQGPPCSPRRGPAAGGPAGRRVPSRPSLPRRPPAQGTAARPPPGREGWEAAPARRPASLRRQHPCGPTRRAPTVDPTSCPTAGGRTTRRRCRAAAGTVGPPRTDAAPSPRVARATHCTAAARCRTTSSRSARGRAGR
mmetsp:Transcript_37273/g.94523  ORF Transcript_37273/g.94523 Transcript_37273/m.94523 type:complete len:207 (+) Transcript_37273:568-1188(+)